MAKSPFFNLLQNMYVMNNIELDVLIMKVPKFISIEEFEEIKYTPRQTKE